MPVPVICPAVIAVPPILVNGCVKLFDENNTGRVAVVPSGMGWFKRKRITPLSFNHLNALFGRLSTTLSAVTATELVSSIGIPRLLEKLNG